MNLYGHEFSLYDLGFSDPTILEPLSRTSPTVFSSDYHDHAFNNVDRPNSPPSHRHDGTSPLPLGMDWSPPPRNWDGRDSIWPHDPHTGWSYCVTIPSWIIVPNSRGLNPAEFYRVQVGIQSPEGITTTRGTLRRFSDFLSLFSELTKAYPQKKIPSAPPRRLLRMRSRGLLDERRCALEDWMQKLLSDIYLSRNAAVAIFLELEAAARSSFHDSNQTILNANSSATSVVLSHPPNPDTSFVAGSSSIASDYGTDSANETSEIGTPRHGRDNFEVDMKNTTSNQELAGQFMKDVFQGNQVLFSEHKIHSKREQSSVDRDEVNKSTSITISHSEDEMEISCGFENFKRGSHAKRLSTESSGSDLSCVRDNQISNLGVGESIGRSPLELREGAEASGTMDLLALSDIQFYNDILLAFPSDERHKLNRVLITMRRALATAKTDMEDLIARLDQELAVRQYLTTKVKDLEVELETTKQSGKDNLQQAILIERERFTQVQWDLEELRRKCLELELKLKSEQDEKVHLQSTKLTFIKENEMVMHELDVAKKQLDNMQKHYEKLELKSKSDVKLLVKEVKSLRGSHLELKQELNKLMKEKVDVERILHEEKKRWDHTNAANAKLLHEGEILRKRLEECSVNFLIEEEDKLIMDSSSVSDAIDLLTTSDNRIGLLLAEAQLLAQDVENAIAAGHNNANKNGGNTRTMDDELRKMLTDIFIDNAKVRKQVNSAIRCALGTPEKYEKYDVEEEATFSKTVLSKFL